MKKFFLKSILGALLVVVFFFVFVSSSFAILSSEVVVLDVVLDLPINFEGVASNFLYLDVDFVMVPFNDSRQKVLFEDYNLELSSRGEGVVSFRLEEARSTNFRANYVLETRVDSSLITEKVYFPLESLDPSLSKFVESSYHYAFDDEIFRKASSLVAGEDDLFKVVFLLADWVNKNVEYDLDAVSEGSLSASWVLENRRGVCTEFSSLLVSFARSLGIPAREVSGFAYTESDLFLREWEFHSWVEVFFPGHGWVPFDPTYGQYGFVDAGHVALGLVSAGSSGRNSFSWRGDVGVLPGETSLFVDVLSKKGSWEMSRLDAEISFLEEEVGLGSYNVVFLELTNNNPFYVSENIRVAGIDGVSFLSPRNKAVVLAPFESEVVPFVVKLSRDLREGFVYTFPVRIVLNGDALPSSFRGSARGGVIGEGDVSVFLRDEKFVDDFLRCVAEEFLRVGEVFVVACDSLGVPGTLCVGNVCDDFVGDEDLSLSLEVFEPGLYTKAVSFESAEGVFVSFIRVLVVDEVSLSFEGTSYSRSVSPGSTGFINVSLSRTSSDVPRNLSLRIVHDRFSHEFVLEELLDKYVLEFSFPANNLRRGVNDFLLEVSFFDSFGEEHVAVKDLKISVDNLSFWDEVSFFFRGVAFWFSNIW